MEKMARGALGAMEHHTSDAGGDHQCPDDQPVHSLRTPLFHRGDHHHGPEQNEGETRYGIHRLRQEPAPDVLAIRFTNCDNEVDDHGEAALSDGGMGGW